MSIGHGAKIRQQKLDAYIERHEGRWTYQRTKTRMNLTVLSRAILSEIVGCFQYRAPVDTGYGAQVGIRIKRVTQPNGKSSRLIYDIIIGTEHPARGGQLKDAPYIAIQNVWDYHMGWINDAISDARGKMRQYDLLVQIYDPVVISKYIRKSAGARSKGGVSGYRVRVSFLAYDAHERNRGR